MYIGIMSGKLCEESLVGFKCITRLYLAVTRYISREFKIRSVYHCCHRLRTEEVVEAAVVPDYPETIFLGYFINASQAKKALIDFSKFLRKNLEAMSHKNLVPINEEIEHTKVYLSLEKIRFGEDLDIVFDINDIDFSLPVLTVQPLVENAVKHGINRSESGCGTVCISTEETEEFHKVVIRDDGGGFDVNTLKDLDGSHIGIFNVRKRLYDECGGKLIIKSAPDKGTECTILIPKEIQDENSGN